MFLSNQSRTLKRIFYVFTKSGFIVNMGIYIYYSGLSGLVHAV